MTDDQLGERTPRIDDACPEGEHDLVWRGNVRICDRCGIAAQTLGDWLGHELR